LVREEKPLRLGKALHSAGRAADEARKERNLPYCRDGGKVGEEASKRCVTCERVPLTLYTLSAGAIVRARFGCLCSSVVLLSGRSDSKKHIHKTHEARVGEGS
jgi:hypothetical protein